MLEDLEAEDDDVVEVNSKASAADGHLQQKALLTTYASIIRELQLLADGFSAMLKLYLSMHACYNFCLALDLNVTLTLAGGNTNFICTKMNLVSCHDVHTLHPMPSAGGSAQLNTNFSNIENQRRHSEQRCIA
ncbi:hypothetical protein H5410_036954 [Solanum commersonii]|uniref:Uncharacterized protein n=1 Tax=Solanum commersonii TaxID=4109 RepID=A0A9J5Y6P1_SOLCO|nr:hypothetical protein H5410_036954 [Solanum commersonii]